MTARLRALRAPALLSLCALLSACEPAVTQGPNVAVGPPPPAPPEPPRDPLDPSPYVGRLRDPALRPGATAALVDLFTAAMKEDGEDRNGPHAAKVIEGIAAPVSEICLDRRFARSARPDGTFPKLVALLAATRHPATIPCLAGVLASYEPDETEQDVKHAVTSLRELRAAEARPALLSVFLRMRPSRAMAAAIRGPVLDAMVDLADASWEGPLIEVLERPLSGPIVRDVLIDELQWHLATAVRLLGELRSAKAVTPLLEVMLTPEKSEVYDEAAEALASIGKPAGAAAVALLEGKPPELVEYARSREPGAQRSGAHLAAAAHVLGTIGRADGAAPIVAALEQADPVSRVRMACELPRLPRTPETVKAFQKTVEKTSLTLTMPPWTRRATEVLLEAALLFFDADLVPWLVKTALAAKGSAQDVAELRESALFTAIKLARAAQLPELDRLARHPSVRADGSPIQVGDIHEEELALTREVLNACKEDVECHFQRVVVRPEGRWSFGSLKALYMTGVLGSTALAPRLAEALPVITDSGVRMQLAAVIDHLTPKGDPESARELRAAVHAAEISPEGEVQLTRPHLRATLRRLLARAEP